MSTHEGRADGAPPEPGAQAGRPAGPDSDPGPQAGPQAESQSGPGAGHGAPGTGPVNISGVSGGAISIGAHSQAVSYNQAPPQTDEATLALLQAVRALRTELRALRTTDETTAVDGELEEIEDEITRTGQAGSGRLAALRDRLETGAGVVGLLASATTVAQAVAQVLG